MGFFDSLSRGLERSREALNQIFYFGGDVTEDFWEDLEDTLVMGDMGADIAMQVTDDLRDMAAKRNLTSARQLREALTDRLAETFVSPIPLTTRLPSSCSWVLTEPVRPLRWERLPVPLPMRGKT